MDLRKKDTTLNYYTALLTTQEAARHQEMVRIYNWTSGGVEENSCLLDVPLKPDSI